MISKQDIEQILSMTKSYVDSLLSSYSDKQKKLASFEHQHMTTYGGGREIDHTTFREFLHQLPFLETNYATDQDIENLFI